MERLKAQYGQGEWAAMSKRERVALLHRDLSSSSDEDEQVAGTSQPESDKRGQTEKHVAGAGQLAAPAAAPPPVHGPLTWN